MGSEKSNLCRMTTLFTALLLTACLLLAPASAAPKPWYQGGGLADCAPGKCPPTAEISPVQCSSDPAMYFNNGYPTNCAEGEECDEAAAAEGAGNPCKVPAKVELSNNYGRWQ